MQQRRQSNLKARLLYLEQQLQSALLSGSKAACTSLVQEIQQLGGEVHFIPNQPPAQELVSNGRQS